MAAFVWPELYFVRHGETDWNAEGRYQGAKDIPLNDRGRGQAKLNGELLQMLLERDRRAATDFSWYVSPLEPHARNDGLRPRRRRRAVRRCDGRPAAHRDLVRHL